MDLRLNRVDFYRVQDLLQAAEDPVAIHMLYQAFFARVGGDVERELVAGSVLIQMEVLGVALARAFAGDGFGGAELHVADQKLVGVKRLRDRFGTGRG